ncbi:HNH endonuclease [Nakamurella leprariae]|uniref:DUF222 domain-containing protein n=1 Tax=Nakamurella leprariae TaxID=2803911 RepID=A0A939C0X8_9ACTN|nr:DUF222 domain-containing protein [Nakamurella leprariae]MBM9466509.1 DUF222 domain-containing protein [Nakamurella leprariae]
MSTTMVLAPAAPAGVAAWVDALASTGPDGLDGHALVELISAAETLKAAAASLQARATTALLDQQLTTSDQSASANEPGDAAKRRRVAVRRSVGAQVALARRVSPAQGGRHLGLALSLRDELPRLASALRRGEVSEWKATLVARETACLTRTDQRQADEQLADSYVGLGDRAVAAEATRIAYRLDPKQAVARNAKAHHDRRVNLRTAPDCMTYLTALLPVVQGVSVIAALRRHADTVFAAGDERGRGQVMADELVARITAGAAPAAAIVETTDDDGSADADVSELPTVPAGLDLTINLIMTDRTLLDGDTEPAVIVGHGPIPASLARHLIRQAPESSRVFIRRLFTDPIGNLTHADPRRRRFAFLDRQFLIARDQTCRTPWCDAPIRHADHIQPHTDQGPTLLDNGQGLCARCNLTKDHDNWHTTGTGPTTVITTPTGHQYASAPPAPPRSAPWGIPTTSCDSRVSSAFLSVDLGSIAPVAARRRGSFSSGATPVAVPDTRQEIDP